MNFHGFTTGKLVFALGAVVCFSPIGWCAADNTAPSVTEKAPLHTSHATHSATAHGAVARKTSTLVRSEHPAARHTVASYRNTGARTSSGRAVPPNGKSALASRRTESHPASQYATRKTSTRNTSASRYATARRGTSARSRHSHPGPLPSGAQQRLARVHLQPERIQEIQQALIREGYLHAEPSGMWDASTHDAMLRYQTDHGFATTGLPEAKSLMKLGLGSHPLPPELDHGPAGVSTPGATQGSLPTTPTAPAAPSSPTSQTTPPPAVQTVPPSL